MWKDIIFTLARLVFSPKKEWSNIESERITETNFLNRFLFPVFGIIALTSFIAELWVVPDGNLQLALTASIIQVVAVFGGFYSIVFFLEKTAIRFDLDANKLHFQLFAGYSSVVIYLLFMVTPFLPELLILWVIALYSVFIVHAGVTSFLHVSVQNRKRYTAFASVLIILTPIVIKMLLESVINILHR